MKGIFFQKPLEFALHIDGESWRQGETIKGRLEIRSHSDQPIPLNGVRVYLADGAMSKVHKKAAHAFDILASAPFKPMAPLAPKSSVTLEWSFPLDVNQSITDSSSSSFLVYGNTEKGPEFKDDPEKLVHLGLLQLQVAPLTIIEEFLDTLRTTYRFVQRTRRAAKAGAEIKLAPPDAKAFSAIELLFLTFRFHDEALEVDYTFHVKKPVTNPGFGGAPAKPVIEKREFEQKIPSAEYLLPSGRVKFERFEEALREVLSTMESKV